MKELVKTLPQYDYLYLGDNARAPYGARSFETVYQYTLEAVDWFFKQGCELVILACNTASAKALRTIQQKDLANYGPSKRVLGVIRPTAEVIGRFSESGQLGVLATKGTVISESYILEIAHFFPEMSVYQQACPMWVPLIENGAHEGAGADYFVKESLDQLLQQSPAIDTILLACTHYPLLIPKISAILPDHIQLIAQGEIVAQSLANYLERHPALEDKCSKKGYMRFCTTDSTADFDEKGAIFFGKSLKSEHILLGH